MQFGVFDHLDLGAVPLGQHYENRLTLIEAYDRLGLRTYHLAEHHATPLGLAPSPSVFLAAVAQRTRRLRFGPLVYTLALHHPLRVAEEICMLDHMSGGRLELGVGRGVSPYEVAYYGVDPGKAQAIYIEALQVILAALAGGPLNYAGEHFKFADVPIELAWRTASTSSATVRPRWCARSRTAIAEPGTRPATASTGCH
jgi:alkanesulfonate monooxygenase SsuD/methylene tetrahydromethanopterin reductase-like flavin-dependent oxidoreductase (luciferase family)